MDIISAQENDWEKYKLIRLESLRQDSSAFGSSFGETSERTDEQWRNQLKEIVEKPHERKLLLAMQGDAPIGCVGGLRRKDGVWILFAVYVSPVFRGKGVSDQLMQTILEKINAEPEANVVELTVNVQRIPALKLYEKHGFKITETLREQRLGDGNTHDEYVMQKVLDSSES